MMCASTTTPAGGSGPSRSGLAGTPRSRPAVESIIFRSAFVWRGLDRGAKRRACIYQATARVPKQKSSDYCAESILRNNLKCDKIKKTITQLEVTIVSLSGGKLYRGEVAAQNGAKIGSDELPLTTIECYISTEFYGSKIGCSTMKRPTYFSGIFAWAGIATVHRSQGNGSFMTINNEFMNWED